MNDGGFRLEELDGVVVARCEALLRIAGFAHAFSTRCASSRADFDLGNAEAPTPAVIERRRRLLRAAGLAAHTPTMLHQVHGTTVVEAVASERPPRADAALWAGRDRSGPAPAVRTADCVPVLLLDREGKAAAAAHAGWRGVAAGVVGVTVEALRARGVVAGDLVVALGPSIGPCCYEVGEEVARAVADASPGASSLTRSREGRLLLDLHAGLRAQLRRAGVADGAIHSAPWCTRCREDLFFSYRRDGPGTGRMMSAVGPAAQRSS